MPHNRLTCPTASEHYVRSTSFMGRSVAVVTDTHNSNGFTAKQNVAVDSWRCFEAILYSLDSSWGTTGLSINATVVKEHAFKLAK